MNLVSACNWVVAIHGRELGGQVTYFGGLDDVLINHLLRWLNAANFAAEKDDELPGKERRNICNCGRRGCGAQLEMPQQLRATLMKPVQPPGIRNLDAYAAAVRGAIEAAINTVNA